MYNKFSWPELTTEYSMKGIKERPGAVDPLCSRCLGLTGFYCFTTLLQTTLIYMRVHDIFGVDSIIVFILVHLYISWIRVVIPEILLFCWDWCCQIIFNISLIFILVQSICVNAISSLFLQFCRLRLSKNVSDRIFSIRFLNYNILELKCTRNPWSSAITRWINKTTFVLNWILKQMFIVKNIYIQFTFEIRSVLGDFHGYQFKLLGDTIMIALVVRVDFRPNDQ